jgi:uncharacterized Zn finger protein
MAGDRPDDPIRIGAVPTTAEVECPGCGAGDGQEIIHDSGAYVRVWCRVCHRVYGADVGP